MKREKIDVFLSQEEKGYFFCILLPKQKECFVYFIITINKKKEILILSIIILPFSNHKCKIHDVLL